MKTIELTEYYANGKIIETLSGLSKPLQDYRKALRKAIGFMNEHRDPDNYHDDSSPEYYIRHDLIRLAEALENLADKENPTERDKELYSQLLGREITDETLAAAKKEWYDMWQKDLKCMQ